MTSPLPLLRSFSTENQNRDWSKRFSLRIKQKSSNDGKLVSLGRKGEQKYTHHRLRTT
ncbi:AGAP013498-PA-like protein [Anopheles sinensis]|nr:AGAP013498-PA-like protein [Anopheles sinensis]